MVWCLFDLKQAHWLCASLQFWKWLSSPSQSLRIGALNLIIDFLAVHWHIRGRFYANLDDITVHPDDFDYNAPIDHDGLISFTGKHEHNLMKQVAEYI
jgi:hypothetical protein